MNALQSFPLIPNALTPPTGCKWTNKKTWVIWNKTKATNSGILTGNSINKGPKHDNNLTVIEIDAFNYVDVKHGFLSKYGNTMNSIIKKFKTFSVKTAGNTLQLYFKYNSSLPSIINNSQHIEILNDGCYVVSPNSSINKIQYKVLNDVEPVEMPDKLEVFLLKLLKQKKQVGEKKKPETEKESGLTSWTENIKPGTDLTQIPKVYYMHKNTDEQKINPDKVITREKLGYEFFNDILKEYSGTPTTTKTITTTSDDGTTIKETITSDSKITKKLCIIVKSDTGTGKTTSMAKYLKSSKCNFVSIVSRVSLGAEQYEKVFSKGHGLKSNFYKNTSGAFKTGENVVVQLESITRLSSLDFSKYVIFLDELNSIIEHVITSSTLSQHRTMVFNLLKNIIKESKLIIGTDADISDICINFMRECGRDIVFIKNTYKHNKDIESEEIEQMDDLVTELKTKDKFMVCCDSKEEADKLFKKLNDKKVIVITSDSLKDYVNLDDNYKIIYSPKIIYGLDSVICRDVYCVFNNKTISPAQMLQQIARSRSIIKLKYIFLNKKFKKPLYSSLKECHDTLKETHASTLSEFGLMKEDNKDFYLNLLSVIEYKNDCYNVNKFCWFKKLLFQRGFKDKEAYFKEPETDKAKDKELKKEIHADRLKDFIKFVPRVNKYLNIPEDKLKEYADLFIDPFKLQKHFNIRKFFFNMTTSEEIKEHIKKQVRDFAVNIASSNDGKMHFMRDLLNKCNKITSEEAHSMKVINEVVKNERNFNMAYNVEHGLNEEESAIYFKKYVQAFQVRVKNPIDFTKPENIQKVLKRCYKAVFGDVITSSTVKKRVGDKRQNKISFQLADKHLKYHETLINFSKATDIDEIDFLD